MGPDGPQPSWGSPGDVDSSQDPLPKNLVAAIGMVINLLTTGAYDGAANVLWGWSDDVQHSADRLRSMIEPAAGAFGLLPAQTADDAITSRRLHRDGRIELVLELVCDATTTVRLRVLAEGRVMGMVDEPLWSVQLIEMSRRSSTTESTNRVLNAAAARPLNPWTVWTRATEADVASLTEPMRRVLAIGWVRSEVNNGGFDQLLSNSAGDLLPVAIIAAREAGYEELADLLERGAEPLVGRPYPVDRRRRQDALQVQDPGTWEPHVDAVTDDYYRIEEECDLDALMGHYAEQVAQAD
jgi:hypothetical protein